MHSKLQTIFLSSIYSYLSYILRVKGRYLKHKNDCETGVWSHITLTHEYKTLNKDVVAFWLSFVSMSMLIHPRIQLEFQVGVELNLHFYS